MSEPKSRRLSTLGRLLIVFILAFDSAFLWQKLEGAYQSEFGGHPDEAAHCVTGLFVRDAMVETWHYAADGFQGSPVEKGQEFADTFYEHYPKVALGVWPPAFHLSQAAWTFPFGVSRTSLLLFMAALAGLTATMVFEVVCRRFGWIAGGAALLLWLCGPLVREHTGLLMAEMQSALTMFGAALAWGAFLDSGRRRDALVFALLASAAIMTKGTGLAILLMCALTIIASRNWRVFARPSFWVAVAIVAILAGIWTWHFRAEGTRVGGWESSGVNWAFSASAFPFYLKAIADSVAYAVAAFALLGMVVTRKSGAIWLSMSGLVVSVLIFQSVIPAGKEARHILALTPALVVLAVAGVMSIARHRSIRVEDAPLQTRRERLWILLLALLSLPQSLTELRPKIYHGFESLAEEVLQVAPPGASVLVVSDASGEGMFISELAMRDARPNLTVARGSKVLVHPEGRTWAGKALRERFHDDVALLDFLLRSKIEYVVLDAAIPEQKRSGYHDQIRRVIGDNTGTFWPVAESPVTRDGEDLFPPLRLYRIVREIQPGQSRY